VREDLAKSRRAHTIVSALLLTVAGAVWLCCRHPMALPFALVGTGVAIAGIRAKEKVLVLGDSELRYGARDDVHDRRGVWPRSRVAKVIVEKVGKAPPPALRGRRFGPVYVVRIVATDGAVHPARFSFRQEPPAQELARAIAGRLHVNK
jgi:hypothetical protein